MSIFNTENTNIEVWQDKSNQTQLYTTVYTTKMLETLLFEESHHFLPEKILSSRCMASLLNWRIWEKNINYHPPTPSHTHKPLPVCFSPPGSAWPPGPAPAASPWQPDEGTLL